MKVIKWALASTGYLAAYSLLTFLTMMIINSIASDDNILQLAEFFGYYGTEEILDLYLSVSFIISTVISLSVIYIVINGCIDKNHSPSDTRAKNSLLRIIMMPTSSMLIPEATTKPHNMKKGHSAP